MQLCMNYYVLCMLSRMLDQGRNAIQAATAAAADETLINENTRLERSKRHGFFDDDRVVRCYEGTVTW